MQLEKGDTAAQELVNSLQVLEVMAGAMAAELKSLVRPLPCIFKLVLFIVEKARHSLGPWDFREKKITGDISEVKK